MSNLSATQASNELTQINKESSSINKKYPEKQSEKELKNAKMLKIFLEIRDRLMNQNSDQEAQNNADYFSQLSTQDLKDLHFFIKENGNPFFSSGQYSEARQIIVIGEIIDDELEKRNEIQNSYFPNIVASPPSSKYKTSSAPSESKYYSPTRPKIGILTKRSVNKIQKFDDETNELIKKMQSRHEQLKEEYISIWEKNMQSHYFKPSKYLQELRKQVLFLRRQCILREEQLKYKKPTQADSKNGKADSKSEENNSKSGENDSKSEENESQFEDFGDQKLRDLISQFEECYEQCAQVESEESEAAQARYERDFINSKRKVEEKQMMELSIFLKERILKRQKLLMNEGVNINAFKRSPGSKSQCSTKNASPLNSRKNSPSKRNRNFAKMPPLISYTKKVSRNATSPETPRNANGESYADLAKEAISQLTPNITVEITSSPALIAIEDRFKNMEKSGIKRSDNFSPVFRKQMNTQTPPSNIDNSETFIDDDQDEMENHPIPFSNDRNRKHDSLPPI